MEIAKIVIQALGLISIGGIINYFIVENKKRKDQSRHEYKEIRYKAILILSHALVNYEKDKEKLLFKRPDIKSKEELKDEIKLEWFNMALYASDLVIIATKNFLENPDQEKLNEMIFAMRKSLYGIKTTLNPKDLFLKD